jgi:hypothetical protein
MKFPKLYLICSYGDFRPALSHVQIGKEYIFAFDAHILVRHKTSEIFKDEFIESLPENPILVPGIAIKLVCQKATVKVSLSEDKKAFQIHRIDDYVISYKLRNDISYPNANSIIPDLKDCQPLSEIGINANLLDRLSDGMGCSIPILHLHFFDVHKQIICTTNYSDYESVLGLIMPTMINI